MSSDEPIERPSELLVQFVNDVKVGKSGIFAERKFLIEPCVEFRDAGFGDDRWNALIRGAVHVIFETCEVGPFAHERDALWIFVHGDDDELFFELLKERQATAI